MNMQAAPGYFDDVSEYSDVFEDGQYVLILVRIENAEGGQYGPSLKWVWTMADPATGAAVPAPDSSGDAYEWHEYSGTKMTPRVKHYPWIVALLGRSPEIGESGRALVQAILGKSMLAYCARPAGEPGARQKILSCKPVATGAPRHAQAPAQAPVYTLHGDPIEPEYDEEADLAARLEAARARKGAANRAKAGVSDATYDAIFKDELPL